MSGLGQIPGSFLKPKHSDALQFDGRIVGQGVRLNKRGEGPAGPWRMPILHNLCDVVNLYL